MVEHNCFAYRPGDRCKALNACYCALEGRKCKFNKSAEQVNRENKIREARFGSAEKSKKKTAPNRSSKAETKYKRI